LIAKWDAGWVTRGRFLAGSTTNTAKRRIESIMSKRRLSSGDVMAALGYSRLNASVGMALARGTQLKPDVIAALEKWLAKNAAV
jgi:hypothetical protein